MNEAAAYEVELKGGGFVILKDLSEARAFSDKLGADQ